MKKMCGVIGLVAVAVVLTTSMPARAQTRDLDFDWLAATVDRLLAGFAPGITMKLGGKDNDGNGIWEDDSLALLSAVMRGGTRVAGLNAGDVTNVQTAFAYNRSQANNDMAATGFTCTILGIAGYPCRLTELIQADFALGPIAGGLVANLLLDYVAGVTTVADNPATINAMNSFLYNVVESFAGSMDSSLWGTIRGLETAAQIGLTASNYHNWGATPHAGSGARNMFGAAGDFDRDGTVNCIVGPPVGGEYGAAGFTGSAPNTWRENFLTGNLIPSAQLPVRCTVLPQASDTVNHITNGDFGSGTTNWTVGGGWSINARGAGNPTGPFQVMAHAAGSANTLVQAWASQHPTNPALRIQPNTTYRVQLDMLNCNAGGSSITVTLGNGSPSAPMTSTTADVVGGDTRTVYVTSGPGANPNFILTPNTTAFWIDNVIINIANLNGDYMDFGTVTRAGGNSPFPLAWEDARDFPGTKDDTVYVYYHLTNPDGSPNFVNGTFGDPNDSGIRGATTYDVIFTYLLPSHDGRAPWLRLSDTYSSPSFTSATVYNPPNPQASPPTGCLEGDALGGRTTPMSIVRVGQLGLAISPQPVGGRYYTGQSVTIESAAVGGDSVPLYQWYKDGSPIAGSTYVYTAAAFPNHSQLRQRLTFNPVSASDAGTYVLRATNLLGPLDSNGAVLQVADHLALSQQPAGANKVAGQSHSMSVGSMGGFAPLTYRWYRGATVLSDAAGHIAGSSTATLSLTNLVYGDQGSYTCVVSDNGTDQVTSNPAILTVLAILTQPTSATVVSGNVATFTIAPQGGNAVPPYTYQWRKNGANITGNPSATTATLTLSACVMADAGDYSCVVGDGTPLYLTSATGQLTVTAAGLVVTTQPVGGNKYVGDSHTFNVAVSAGSGFTKTYQWQKAQVDIPGATSSSYTINPLATTDTGNYRCKIGETGVRPPAAWVYSNEVTLNVQPHVSFTVQPVGGNKAAGMSHLFTATATGGYPPYTYQWRRNGTPIYTGQNLNLPNLAYSDQATSPGYTCVVADSNTDGAVSNVAPLTVLAIQTSPSDREVNAGSATTFTVVVQPGSGVPGYTYQWRKNGLPIGNATDASYTITSCQSSDEGSYACLVTDSALASLLSGAANLTITTQSITISTQPTGGNLYVGDSKTFTCIATGGNGTLTYQWQKDGSDLTGQTATTLNYGSLVLGNQGNYQCLVGDAAHPPLPKVGSNTVNLQVRDRISIPGQPATGHKAVGGSHTFSVTAAGGYTPLSYQWYKGASPISGATNSTLNMTGLVSGDQATYHCLVADSNGSSLNSNNADLTVLAIQTSPADREVPALSPTTFTVVPLPGSGFGAYTYQWRKDAVNILNATDASYTIGSCLVSDEGLYDCTVGDAGGASLLSAAARLTVSANPIVINTPTTPGGASKYVGPASSFTFICAASGGSGALTYQWQKNGVDLSNDAHLTGVNTNTLRFATNFVLGDDGAYQCMVGDDVHPPMAKVGTGLAQLNIRNRLQITGQPSGGHKAGGTSHSFTVTATGGYLPLSYTWQYSPTNVVPIPWVTVYTGGATYTIPSLTAANQGYYRCVVGDSFTATANSSTVNLLVLDIQTQPASTTADIGGSASFSVVVVAGSGTPPYTYQWKYKGANIPGATTSSYSKSSIQAGSPDGNPVPVNPTGNAGDYVCVVTDSNPGQVSLSSAAAILAVNYTPMSCSLQPVGGDKYTGGSHTFTVAATGGAGAPYTYQWQRGGVNITGATTATLALNPLALTDDADYRCMLGMVGVRPPMPSIASDPATLRVRDPLAVTDQPAGANKAAGGNHAFTVAVSGGFTPLAYQWHRGALGATPGTGTPVGANSDTLALTGLAPADQGTYSCVITDANIGTVTTGGADLRVLAIQTQPASQTVDVGNPVTFTVTLVPDSGLDPYAYQWTYKGGDIGGATGASYTIASCQAGSPDAVPQPLNPAGNAGDYACVITDAGAATLTTDLAALAVTMAPITFTEQPASGRRYVGGQQVFHVAVTGGAGPAYTYQWTKEGANISGATAGTLTINPVALGDVGSYTCLIGEVGVRPPEALVPSDVATLDVAPPIRIDTQPVGADLYIGETFTASVAASGGFGALTYQWYLGAALLTGETGSMFSKTNVQAGDAGSYHCVVSDELPTPLASDDAVLTVSPPISILTHPVGGEAEGGEPWSMSVVATGGKGTLHYAWTKNGDPIGTDDPTYSIATAGLGDAGTYVCAVSDSGTPPASVPSNPAILTIHAVFAIDEQPADGKAYLDDSFSLHVHATFNRGDLSYQWYGPNPDVAIAGATTDTFEIAAVATSDAGTYKVTVTDDNGTPTNTGDDATLTSNLATVVVGNHLRITGQPQSGHAPVGGAFTFSVGTDGGFSPLSYEWYKNTKDVLVGTTQQLTLSPLLEADFGTYHVVARDSGSDVIVSNPATVDLGTGMPVAGMAGLAILAMATALCGTVGIRRKR